MRKGTLFARTFRGGVHPTERKDLTSARPVEEMPPPPEIVVHLHQHTGAPCQPLVAKGDKVLAGQKIGDAQAFITAPVHSPVSGEVKAVEPRFHFTGARLAAVVIVPDGEQKEQRLPVSSSKEPPAEEVRRLVREAGIVGLGGAAFPTHVKLSPPKDKPIEAVIVNGCECEPYLTCDHRNMLERADRVVDGLRLIMATVGARRAVIALEDNKMDAAEALGREAGGSGVEIRPLPTKYPQGAEKQLIKSLLGREVPSGRLPMDVGAVVQNVGTAIAVSEAVREGKALTRRTLTVSGQGVAEPKNLSVMIGTSMEQVVQFCGGLRGDVIKMVMGGPMTGFAQYQLDVPTVKGTSGILALTREEAFFEPPDHRPCIRCGRCVEACPMAIMPNYLGQYARLEMWDMTDRFNVMDCIECGCCGWVCPSRIPLVQLFKLAKAKVLASRAKK